MLKDDCYSDPKFQLKPSVRYISTTGFRDVTTQMSRVKSFQVASGKQSCNRAGTFVPRWVIDKT